MFFFFCFVLDRDNLLVLAILFTQPHFFSIQKFDICFYWRRSDNQFDGVYILFIYLLLQSKAKKLQHLIVFIITFVNGMDAVHMTHVWNNYRWLCPCECESVWDFIIFSLFVCLYIRVNLLAVARCVEPL